MAEPCSNSKKQRERGNVFFKSATGDFGTTIRISRLENAVKCYHNALACSDTQDDAASACKNIGMASWRLACVFMEGGSEEDDKVIQRHFKIALQHLCMAYIRRHCKGAVWSNQLEESWDRCLKECAEWLAEFESKERISGFSDLLVSTPDCKLKAGGYVQFATVVFHEGLTAWQDGEYKACYRCMRECYFPVQEAARLSEGDASILSEVTVLQEDVFIHTCVAESSMARATGDSMLESELQDQEEWNTDMVWTVMDFYQQAAMLCRDKDLEQEAIAYSRMGRVYGKVLKMESRGKDYYKQAIELALSMTPRTFHGIDWYTESTAFVENFQKRLNRESEDSKERTAALKEMKKDVNKLHSLDSKYSPNEKEFVEKVYKTWPPKDPEAKLEEALSLPIKKLLVKAISHYHPDKVDQAIHGKNWFYFSSEITKCLNRRYSCIKCPDADE